MAQYDLGAIAFPTLDETVVIAALGGRASASLKRYLDGQTLFQAGDRDFKFFVVKSGHVEIVDPSGETPRIIAVHQPGEFTGDVAHLTGSPALVSAIARGDCQVYEIESEGLRQLLDRSPSVGDVILQAFIARRQLLRESGNFTGVRIIGSRYSRDTFRIREFLAKNRVPFTWLDLEGDSQVKSLLDRFAVSESETPVVAWRDWLLRNPSTRQLSDVLGLRRSPDQNGVRPDCRWGRAGGSGRRGLRRVGRASHAGAGTSGAGRTGQRQHARRELPRLPDGAERERSRRSRGHSGSQVWRATFRVDVRYESGVRQRVRVDAAR